MRALFLTSAVVALSSGMAQADYTLHVIHINDLHSRIEHINAFDSTCSAEDAAENKCFGGVARVATKIKELRDGLIAEGQNVIVLDAGDQFQGSLFYTTYKGAAEAEFMEKIGFDAMAVGNHEFDDGPEGLASFLDKVTFPGDQRQHRRQPVECAGRAGPEPCGAGGRGREDRHHLGPCDGYGRYLQPRAKRDLSGRDRQPERRCRRA